MATKLIKAILLASLALIAPMAAGQAIHVSNIFRSQDDELRTGLILDVPTCWEAATSWISDPFDSCSDDANIRMEQMLYASEDLRNLREEWRRYWFTDMPSNQTPQRVHGGIYP